MSAPVDTSRRDVLNAKSVLMHPVFGIIVWNN